MSHKDIKGKVVGKYILDDVKARVSILRERGWQARLASIEIGNIPAVSMYVRNQQRVCQRVGIEFDHRQFPQDITQNEVLATIRALNVDPRISGIILQRPVPSHISLRKIQQAIHPSKDVEGMSPVNIGKVVYGGARLGPCTSLAAVEALRHTGLTLHGLDAVIVGHSEIVGKPIAMLLLEELSTITICHHGTRNLAYHTRRAEALFVAVGKPGLITADMIQPGAAVIDIGINQIDVTQEDGTVKQKTVGDVDYDSVIEVAGWITPVPGGVGPITLAFLMKNTVATLEKAKEEYERTMIAG